MSTGCESGCWTREGDEEERRVEGKAREDRYIEAVKNRSLARRAGNFIYFVRTHKGENAPGELFSPSGINSGDVRTTLLPLGLPDLTAINRGTVEVRASQRLELHFGEVQRRPGLTGRRERIEIRRVDEGVVASCPRAIVGDLKRKRKKKGSKLHISGLAIQWKQM
jgi:hypothetical protein